MEATQTENMINSYYEFRCKNCGQMIIVEDEIEEGNLIDCNNCFTSHRIIKNNNVFDIERRIRRTEQQILSEIKNWIITICVILGIIAIVSIISLIHNY